MINLATLHHHRLVSQLIRKSNKILTGSGETTTYSNTENKFEGQNTHTPASKLKHKDKQQKTKRKIKRVRSPCREHRKKHQRCNVDCEVRKNEMKKKNVPYYYQ